MTTIIAHRGARSIAPENTIAAARKALRAGAGLWETDVAVTRDERLILFHDDLLQRTTDVASVFPDRQNQTFTEFTLAEIRQLNPGLHFVESDPFGEIKKGSVSQESLVAFKQERVPTLEEALVFTRDNLFKVNVELKILPEKFRDFPVVERVMALVKRVGITPDQLLFSSFNHSWLRQVEALAPAFEIQALIGRYDETFLDWGDFSFATYNARSTLIDDAQIVEAKNRGKAINLFTVNEQDEMIRSVNAGIDGLITDYPQRFVSIIRE